MDGDGDSLIKCIEQQRTQLPDGDLDASDTVGFTALMRAAQSGHELCVELLLSAGARHDATNNAGQTALDLARERGRSGVVSLLEGAQRTPSSPRGWFGGGLSQRAVG